MQAIKVQEALDYHRRGNRPGKVCVMPTKPLATAEDLALAYTPGVAEPVRAIAGMPELAYKYTAKGNLVGVVTNGTAVLGLGNQGALAAKPVMEGKAVLFKRFADIDVFDIEIDARGVDDFVNVVAAMGPTFGGINLEDVKGPECFEIEERLQERLDIPVFHDDQHGTAIVVTAGLINALAVAGKEIDSVRVVVCGAGAGALASARLAILAGVRRENVTVVDSRGVIYRGREGGMNPHKAKFAIDTAARTLADATRNADVFIGLSAAGALSPDLVKSMARKPIVFALSNPEPEIRYELAKAARPDAIVASGRSDYPNQVNNVLAFPHVFRGALDAQASRINDAMKLAAARALAELATKDVPECVSQAYEGRLFRFGPEYIIPKPLDPRTALYVAPAVVAAAMESGVARRRLALSKYRFELQERLKPIYRDTHFCGECLFCRMMGVEKDSVL